jgi:hypothetical protein
MSIAENYRAVQASLPPHVTLVAVSKTKPIADLLEVYNAGHRDFGENYVQELVDKQAQLPLDIRWHFIGHLQSNKVKYIAPFVHLVHGVDSFKLLQEINKQASKNNRVIDVLLQIHIAKEETKFGLDAQELKEILEHPQLPQLQNIRIKGLMGMASFTPDESVIREEFRSIKSLADEWLPGSVLSIGMSSDYRIAIEEGSTIVRIGSSIFGKRD